MSLRSLLCALLVAILVCVPPPSLAQLYRWVDEKGVVNYGESPPQGAKDVRPLDEKSGTVSVVPGIPKEEIEKLHEREARQRQQALEREAEEKRAREMERASAPQAPANTEGYPPGYGYGLPPLPRPPPPKQGRGDLRPEHPIAPARPPVLVVPRN